MHGCQVMSLLCQNGVIMSCRIRAYIGTLRSLFINSNAVFNGEHKKNPLFV